jgi:hypothetical protein
MVGKSPMAIRVSIHEQLGGMQQLVYVVISFNDVGKLLVVNVGAHLSQLKSSCHDMNIWYQVSPYYVL